MTTTQTTKDIEKEKKIKPFIIRLDTDDIGQIRRFVDELNKVNDYPFIVIPQSTSYEEGKEAVKKEVLEIIEEMTGYLQGMGLVDSPDYFTVSIDVFEAYKKILKQKIQEIK